MKSASKISHDIKEKYSHVPWKDIIGIRNRLIHGYFDIDVEIIKQTLDDDLPILLNKLREII